MGEPASAFGVAMPTRTTGRSRNRAVPEASSTVPRSAASRSASMDSPGCRLGSTTEGDHSTNHSSPSFTSGVGAV